MVNGICASHSSNGMSFVYNAVRVHIYMENERRKENTCFHRYWYYALRRNVAIHPNPMSELLLVFNIKQLTFGLSTISGLSYSFQHFDPSELNKKKERFFFLFLLKTKQN